VRGSAIDWEGFDRGYTRRKVALPTYPFQRQRYWVQSRPAGRAPAPLRPLIDKVTPLPQQQLTLYEREFSVESLPSWPNTASMGSWSLPALARLRWR
jgi:acyl transferase domain-containing protein